MKRKISRREFLKSIGAISIASLPHNKFSNRLNFLNPNLNKPNVIIILFDALSARHMSLYGYHRDTTPTLSRLANRATIYHRHYSAGNFTTPGTASLLTGTYPWTHRGLHIRGTVLDEYKFKNIFHQFSQNGYQTIAYSHNSLVDLLFHQFGDSIDLLKPVRELGLFYDHFLYDCLFNNDQNIAFWSERSLSKRGVDLDQKAKPIALYYGLFHQIRHLLNEYPLQEQYKKLFPRGLPMGADREIIFTLEDAIDWIENQISHTSHPFLGYFHLFPPHNPYNTRIDFVDIFNDNWHPPLKETHVFAPGNITEENLQNHRSEYDEYIAYVDAEFGRLYDSLVNSGVLNNSYLILTSDHGESFERGIAGHITPVLYESLVHIPLVIFKPGQITREDVFTPTSSIDLLPTLLHATAQNKNGWMEGEILPTFDNQKNIQNRSIFVVDAKENSKYKPLSKGSMALIQDPYKLMHYFGYGEIPNEYELYNIVEDPEELENLHLVEEPIFTQMKNILKNKLDEVNKPYRG